MSTAQKKANASNADMRPFPYTVRVVGYEPIIFQEHAPAFLCSANPPVNEGKAFLSKLVMKHQQEVMASKPWGCSGCNRSAISMVHTPMMYLHLPEPFVVDFAQPVCQNGGDCENRVFCKHCAPPSVNIRLVTTGGKHEDSKFALNRLQDGTTIK